MDFQFDPNKARSNFSKHGISFADAEHVFYDPLAIHIIDEESKDEERWIIVGMSNINEIIVVIYTHRYDEIRLISARKATRNEVKAYEE